MNGLESDIDMSRFCIVLCRPKEARNVGGCIRAAANAGLTTVRIVSGSKDNMDENRAAATDTFEYDEIDTFSAGAVDLITVEYHDALESAIGDCHIVIGTSGISESKRGPKRAGPALVCADESKVHSAKTTASVQPYFLATSVTALDLRNSSNASVSFKSQRQRLSLQ